MYSVIARDGNQYGPVDLNTIQQWIQEGRVVPDTIILDGVTGNRGPASQFPLIAPHLSQGSPPTAHQPQVINQVHQPGTYYPQVGAYSQPPNPYAQYPRPGVGTVHGPPKPGHTIIVVLVSIFVGGWLGNILNGQIGKGVLSLAISILLAIFTCGMSLIVTYPLVLVDAILGARKVENGQILGQWEFF